MTHSLEKTGFLDGHVALVTGGATGIGRAMAEAMAKAGAKVWIASRNDAAINLAIAELRAADLSVHGARLDVTDRAQVESVVGSIVEKDKKIDILFNGAGVMIKQPVIEMPEDVWDRVIEVNLKGVFLCTQAVARGMIARRYGRIINVTSGHVKGNASNSAYAASKGGLESFTKSFAAELAQLNIDVTINAIEPGGTDTAMWRQGKSAEYIKRAVESGRIRPPNYMRDVVMYLASPASRAVNGKMIDHRARADFVNKSAEARIEVNRIERRVQK
jgi:NAD(P)-dependent dehydrogenase (short-subunit alcohol dehydrogenase family)